MIISLQRWEFTQVLSGAYLLIRHLTHNLNLYPNVLYPSCFSCQSDICLIKEKCQKCLSRLQQHSCSQLCHPQVPGHLQRSSAFWARGASVVFVVRKDKYLIFPQLVVLSTDVHVMLYLWAAGKRTCRWTAAERLQCTKPKWFVWVTNCYKHVTQQKKLIQFNCLCNFARLAPAVETKCRGRKYT